MSNSVRPIASAYAVPGTPFPDAVTLRADGSQTTLAAERGHRTTVVVFYRGTWCPYCNTALRSYQQVLFPELQSRGIGLIAVSPQHPDGSLSMSEKQSLDFPVLSDPGNSLARALGILTRPTDDALAQQRERGLHVEEHNADGTADLPMPTTAIVTADGTLAWIDVHPDHTTRTEPAQILRALADLEVEATRK
jgi:peroxiredoxin